ncbi:MAG: hypothetical protein RSE07_06590, partial [Oscillospiraceae bacterium]
NKKDIKSTLKVALSLFVNHICGALLAWIVCIGFLKLMDSTYGLIVCEILVLLAYSLPGYYNLWHLGFSDINKINFGHIKKDNFKGFKLAAIALIPSYLMGIGLILAKFNLFPNIMVAFKFTNAHLWPLINLINPSAYMSDISVIQIIIIALLTIIPNIIFGFAYILGLKEISISQRLMYKKNKE